MKLKTGDLLTVVTAGAADVDVHVSYQDRKGNAPSNDGRKNTAITTATTTTILEGPSGGSNVRALTDLIVRNIDSSSNTVTIKHYDGTTTVEVYKGTIEAGAQVEWNEVGGWTATTTNPGGETLLTVAANVANAAVDTLANVTGLTFAVDAGDTYVFEAILPYLADATTSGSRWTINGPAASAGTAYTSEYSLGAGTVTKNPALAAVQLPAAANATSTATTGNVAYVSGVYIPSTAGTFAIQFAAEAGTITALAGGTCRIRKVINA